MMLDAPRVSAVLALMFPGTLDFVAQRHLDRGTELHFAMECWANNIIYGVGQQDLLKACEPVAEWLLAQGIELEAAEWREAHHYGYILHPDLLGIWKNIPYVFDYKFAEQITEMNLIQMEAYMRATKRPGCFIQCDRAGKVTVKKVKPDPARWAAFLSALNVKKFHIARGLGGED